MERVLSVDMLEPVGGYERCSKKLSQLANELIVSAEKSEIPILDLYHLFMGKGGDVLGDYFLEDGLHPNKQGHRLIAKKIAELMRSVFNFL
jgi:lysophospholipase L1-like esterase